jgi:hypothetical protein
MARAQNGVLMPAKRCTRLALSGVRKKKAGKLPALKASAGRMPSLLLLLSCSANDQFAFHART